MSRPVSPSQPTPDQDPEKEPRLGSIVTDREIDADHSALVVDVTGKTADEYVLAVSNRKYSTVNYTVADRAEKKSYPDDDPVFIVVFGSVLDGTVPAWKETPMEAVVAFRNGAFATVSRALPQSRLRVHDADPEDTDP